jgi:hypothetical protein
MRRRFTRPSRQRYNSHHSYLPSPTHRPLRTGAPTTRARPFPAFGDRVDSATVSLLAMLVVAAIELQAGLERVLGGEDFVTVAL